jgi:uncharacterized OB-fold protein
MNAPVDRPLPYPDRDSRPWWEALARHELILQRCAACGAWRWPARALCGRCGSLDWTWAPASGRGTVASWIVNHHAFSRAFPSPYVVLLVRLEEQDDLLLPGASAGDPSGRDLAVGLAVIVTFEDLGLPEGQEPVTLLRWLPSDVALSAAPP